MGREYVELRKKGTTVGHLRVPEVFNFPVIVPPTDEQQKIVEFLHKEIEGNHSVEQQVRVSVDRLLEYRSALITTAVTGQLPELNG
jgi:type I restriction enzyme S subunit